MGDPVYPWRDGVILPVPERLAGEVEARGHRMTLLFPATGLFLATVQASTPAQLEVALSEHVADSQIAPYLDDRRMQQAVLRVAVQLIAGADAQLGPMLQSQSEAEAAHLGGWLSTAPASRLSMADAAAELRGIVGNAELLATLCKRASRAKVADKVLALGRALGHVAEDMRS
jgi:multidrug efflux pump subunit AcrA (membrane-fusion protein)